MTALVLEPCAACAGTRQVPLFEAHDDTFRAFLVACPSCRCSGCGEVTGHPGLCEACDMDWLDDDTRMRRLDGAR